MDWGAAVARHGRGPGRGSRDPEGKECRKSAKPTRRPGRATPGSRFSSWPSEYRRGRSIPRSTSRSPPFTTAFGNDVAAIQWVIICNVLTYASLMPGLGRLADIVGHKRLFVMGLLWERGRTRPLRSRVDLRVVARGPGPPGGGDRVPAELRTRARDPLVSGARSQPGPRLVHDGICSRPHAGSDSRGRSSGCLGVAGRVLVPVAGRADRRRTDRLSGAGSRPRDPRTSLSIFAAGSGSAPPSPRPCSPSTRGTASDGRRFSSSPAPP